MAAQKSRGGPRPRRVPRRTCVACRQEQPKRGLIRLVRTIEGPVEVDSTGKRAGRGAYLCADPACWDKGLSRKMLDQALRTPISPENRESLRQYAAALPVSPTAPVPPAAESLSESR